MSFQRKALKLDWPEDHELHGLEVLCRRPTIGQVSRVESTLENTLDAETMESLIRDTIGKAVITWNYRDEEGQEVAATPDGLASIDLDAQMEILTAWTTQAVGVPKDLGKASDSGQQSPAAKFVMPVTGSPGLSDALRNLPMLSGASPSSGSSPDTP